MKKTLVLVGLIGIIAISIAVLLLRGDSASNLPASQNAAAESKPVTLEGNAEISFPERK